MKPIENGVSLYLNIPRPIALKRKIDKDTELVMFDYPDRLVFIKKESMNVDHSGHSDPDSQPV